jgi:hypothetical protein
MCVPSLRRAAATVHFLLPSIRGKKYAGTTLFHENMTVKLLIFATTITTVHRFRTKE